MPASLDDLFTSAKNIVVAINNAAQTYLNVNGNTSLAGITAATVVKATPGRVCSVSVIVAGAAGAIYDSTISSATAYPVFTIPATVGVFQVNIATLYGIVVAPGAGQTVTIGFS